MASSRDEKRVDLVATDGISRVADAAADSLDAIPDKVTTTLDATDNITADVGSIRQRLAGLADEDVRVVLTARADQLQREVGRSLTALRNLDRYDDEEIRIRIEARDGAKAKLEAVQAEIRDLDGETATVDVKPGSGFDDLTGRLDSLPGKLGDLAGTLGGLAGPAAIGGIVTALAGAADHAADLAISAQTTATLTGDTVEDASRLQAVWATSGADVNDLNDIMLQLNGVLQTTPEIARQLGVNLGDGRTVGQRFVEVVDLLRGSTLGAAEKAQLMSQAFGEEGVRQVAALTSSIDGPLQAAVDEVADTRVITPADVAAAADLKRDTAALKGSFDAAATSVGQGMIPLLTQATSLVGELAKGLPGGDQQSIFNVFGSDKSRADMADTVAAAHGAITAVTDWTKINEGAARAASAQADLFDPLTVALDDTADAYDRSHTSGSAWMDLSDRAAEQNQRIADLMTEQSKAIVDALEAEADALNGQVDAATSAADAQLTVNDAMTAFADTLKDSESTVSDRQKAAIDLAKSTQDLHDKQAAANGVIRTSTERLDDQNQSLLATARTADGPARDAILAYTADLNDIDPLVETQIKAAIDAGDLDTANRLLAEASAPRTAAVKADADTAAAATEMAELAKPRTSTVTANVVVNGVRNLGGGKFQLANGIVVQSVPPPAAGGGESAPGVTPFGPGAPAVPAAAAIGGGGMSATVGVTAVVPAVTVNVNTAVIGNRFDVARAVRGATRDGIRLAGRR